jgi:drug/metabolite transporter (DMT)-like permease
MKRLIALGTLAALFFSSTFVLNRAMSLEGGHWVWTASLRFGYMLIFLSALLAATLGARALVQVYRVFRQHWKFWIVAGSIGFGIFYSLITFSVSYAPGWIIAATWQITILATPMVLRWFGKPVPHKGMILSALIFVGVLLINLEHANSASAPDVLASFLPVLIAAFAYPIGNQLVWEAAQNGHTRIPHITHPILQNSLARVLLLTLGSIPFWIALVVFAMPPPPSTGQLVNTALIALFSGVVATSIFLSARQRCQHPYEIAAVDATQSLEVIFSLLGEIIFLQGLFPGLLGFGGIALTIVGLVAYIVSGAPKPTSKRTAPDENGCSIKT